MAKQRTPEIAQARLDFIDNILAFHSERMEPGEMLVWIREVIEGLHDQLLIVKGANEKCNSAEMCSK